MILVGKGKTIYEISDMLAVMIPREIQWPVNKAYESRNPSKEGELFLSNTNHVKGLEFPFVICATSMLSNSFNHRNALYMAITRSFLKTFFLIKEEPWSDTLNRVEHGLETINQEGVIRVTPPPIEDQERIRANVKWQGGLRTLDEIILEALTALDAPPTKIDKYLNAMKMILEPGASVDEIEKLAKNLIKGY
ncbi:MAG: ATP-binding domain-containing protein [Pseudomonadota bacterium]|nr:ATP-binding domain-containing protein [Gammaproteobacteria bacterium]